MDAQVLLSGWLDFFMSLIESVSEYMTGNPLILLLVTLMLVLMPVGLFYKFFEGVR